MITNNTPTALALQNALSNHLQSLGEVADRDGILETPARFVKQLGECLSGYQDDPAQHVKVFEGDGYHDLVLVRDVTFSSLCEHHVLPFFGTIDIAYLPNEKILGLSKFARLIDALSKRLQVQERITQQLADILETNLQPHLLIVKISAKHMCMGMRGVRRPNSSTDTVIVRGDKELYKHYIEQFFHTTKGGRS